MTTAWIATGLSADLPCGVVMAGRWQAMIEAPVDGAFAFVVVAGGLAAWRTRDDG